MNDRRPLTERLNTFYTPEITQQWLLSPHPELNNNNALNYIMQTQDSEPVHRIIDKLAATKHPLTIVT